MTRSPGTSKVIPIKIMTVEPNSQYCKTVWCAIGIGLSQLMIGATNMVILMYALRMDDLHSILCTVGYHFFSAEAILSLNYANGWSTPMRQRHRRFVHVLLQLCALACAITGTALVIVSKGISASPHGITGIIAAALAILSALSGLLALIGKSSLRTLHVSFGIPAFLMSTISLSIALFTDRFRNWADHYIAYLLLSFILFYTVFIVVTSFIKCMARLYNCGFNSFRNGYLVYLNVN